MSAYQTARRKAERRAGLQRRAPVHVIMYSEELHEWRGAILRSSGLTNRDKRIAFAHAHRVDKYDEGTVRGHFASNADIARVAGMSNSDDGANRSVRIANEKLARLGFVERIAGPRTRSTAYTYLLRLPE